MTVSVTQVEREAGEVELRPGVNVRAGERFLRGDDLEPVWRDPLALAMFAAWVNAPVDKIPAELRAHTCESTKAAWRRVADVARQHRTTATQELVAALEKCRYKFAHYTDLHRLKCTAEGDEKADRNQEMVDLIDAALSTGQQP